MEKAKVVNLAHQAVSFPGRGPFTDADAETLAQYARVFGTPMSTVLRWALHAYAEHIRASDGETNA